MKVYLRDIQTRTYYQRQGKWTFDRQNAWNFQSVLDALDWSQNLKQIQLEVVLGFDDGQEDIRLSLGCIANTKTQPARLAA